MPLVHAIVMNCDSLEDNNYGTHVSGTIGAAGNSGVGVAEVNWTASIVGAKFLNSGGSKTGFWEVERALPNHYATTNS